MKIVLFTVDHLEYAPRIVDPFLEEHGEMVERIYVSQSIFNLKFLWKRSGLLMRNLYPFCISAGDIVRYIGMKINQAKTRRKIGNVLEYYRDKSFKVDFVEDINDYSFIQELTEIDADVYLFVLVGQIAREEFLNTAKRGVYNLHTGKLPEYRGGLSAFWVLRFGDDTAGVTLHRAIDKLDAGDVITESRFKVTTNSMKELMEITMDCAAKTLIEGVERLKNGEMGRPCSAEAAEGYYFIPGRRDFQEFYRRGCRLI